MNTELYGHSSVHTHLQFIMSTSHVKKYNNLLFALILPGTIINVQSWESYWKVTKEQL